MPKRTLGVNLVDIPPPVSRMGEVPLLLQLPDDSLDGTLGNADHPREITNAEQRILREREEHVRVVGEKGPSWASVFALLAGALHGTARSREQRSPAVA